MSRILVTGVSGFIGSNLVPHLKREGHEVYGIFRTPPSFTAGTRALDQIHVLEESKGSDNLEEICRKTSPEILIHLASTFIAAHQSHQVSTLVTSIVDFPTRILDITSSHGLKQFINVGTLWQFFNGASHSPVNLYAALKESFEKVIDYYSDTTTTRFTTLYLTDTYGPGDTRNKIISQLFKASRDNTKLRLSPGAQLLSLVNVDDVARAFLDVLGDSKAKGRYRVDADQLITLRELVSIVEKTIGSKIDASFGATPYRQREIMNPIIPYPRVPNWSPKISIDEGIKMLSDQIRWNPS